MRHKSPILLLLGQNELVGRGEDGHKILNVCMKNRLVYRDLTINSDGQVSLWCTPYTTYILMRECKREGIDLSIKRRIGLPFFLSEYSSRVGLWVGLILSIFIIFISDNYIWDVRISGNETVTVSKIYKALEESGLSVGSRISELDVDSIESRVLIECKDISWIAINLVGTHANVQIREMGELPRQEESAKPSNLIAARDGQIEYLELFGGNAIVRIGDTVRKGDLLVSGLWDSNHYGLLITRSSGRVFAKTNRTFTVTVPFEYVEKKVTKRKMTSKSLIFFSKEIKVFEKYGKDGGEYDTIEEIETVRLFNGDKLPIGVRSEHRLYYETVTLKYTDSRAMELAYYRLSKMIEAELPEGQILKKMIETEITDEAFTLRCSLTAIENIAVMQEFESDLVYGT